jgi:hypothetical protein
MAVENEIRAYAEYLDEILPTVTADEARPAVVPTGVGRSGWWRGRPGLGFVAAVLAVFVAAVLFVIYSGLDGAIPGPSSLPAPDSDAVATPETSGQGQVFGVPIGIKTSGGYGWAWDDHEIRRYSDRAWTLYATTETRFGVSDLAYALGSLWVIDDGVVRQEIEGRWHRLPTSGEMGAWRIEAAPDGSALWVSTGEYLHLWDDTELTNVGRPPNYPDGGGFVGEIAVTADGTVWAGGLYGYLPWMGGLARYDPGSGQWEMVRPLGGDEDVPALLVASADGNLWAMLVDWPEPAPEDGGDASVVMPDWALARYVSATGEWSTYTRDLPQGFPMSMAADGEVVWLAQGRSGISATDEIGGILRFDGRTWTTFLEDVVVTEITAAGDGTVWYTTEWQGEIRRLDADG